MKRIRRLFGCIVLAMAACDAAASDSKEVPKDAANRLTAEELAGGSILLFDGETTFGWSIDGEARVENGVLILGGKKRATAISTTAFGDFLAHYEARWSGQEAPKWGVMDEVTGETFSPFQPKYHEDALKKAGSDFGKIDWTGRLERPVRPGFTVPAGSKLHVRNFKLRPSNLKSIFNGKDLSGWKIFPDRKSKFTVKEGAINIKDGPGDLQTTEKYGDFVLQLECMSHGKHLNSGVFFRCRDNEYQNGYEVQVRNQFVAPPGEVYKLPRYDPKTHEEIGVDKVVSPAVDFGTGGIYRRQPARKAMSKDGEWFALTLIARGNHFATWVNGIQVADWTDHRFASDNARTGYRLEAGHISLQGHDPTTDLSFRAFRIAPLSRPRK